MQDMAEYACGNGNLALVNSQLEDLHPTPVQ